MPDSDGATLIAWAIGGGSKEIVRFLLLHNVKTNYVYQVSIARDFTLENGLESLLGEVGDLISHMLEMTPLSLAASKGDQSIIKLLLANGTDRHFGDTIGCTAVFWAAKRGHSSSLKLLATDSTDCKKQLQIAIIRGEELAVANLVESGIVDLNMPGPTGVTPLGVAAYGDNETIMDSLLRLSVIQPDLKDHFGMTPLATSALFGKHKMIRQLLNSGRVNVNSINDFDLPPVALAVALGHQTAARTILEFKQVDMRQKDSLGRTITALAAVGGNKAIFDMLSQYGQPYTVEDKLGRTPLFYAIKGGNHRIVQSILSHSRVSVEVKDAFGALPLSMAARFGDTASAALLLRENAAAQLRSRDMFGRSPLAWCAIEGHTSTRDFLLQKCRELGIRTGDETLPPANRRMRRFKWYHNYCDICFLYLGHREPYYTCGKCFNGLFSICCECRTRLRPQPGCLQDFHRIVLRSPSND
ncbi:ankyrin repeat domain-containing protein [Aspergillus melleus]|uniref:ankyrin repeat domain-containing protein n=1 Tax=Aspergillus melleus TaxID=138277 RepID=UPI001E8ED8B7|nr:uncharacterized protein LDX57_007147 [Aspergillus melleus]KAH8429485.1 hypothetical protein LDX57_007147 [Aspergillus melleus]